MNGIDEKLKSMSICETVPAKKKATRKLPRTKQNLSVPLNIPLLKPNKMLDKKIRTKRPLIIQGRYVSIPAGIFYSPSQNKPFFVF